MEIVQEVWNAYYSKHYGVVCCIEHVVGVEKHPTKRNLLLTGHHKMKHVFGDVQQVAEGRAWDYKEERPMNTDFELDCLVAGFPCKDLCSLKVDPGKFNDASSATGSGMLGTLRWAARVRPKLLILENIMGLLKRFKANNDDVPIDWHDSVVGVFERDALAVQCRS